MTEVTQDILKTIYKKRQPSVKKYDFGLLLVIGGSEFYSGPPALSALAAFRTGVDMVRIIAPKRAADIIASFSPDLAAYPLEGNWLVKKHLPNLISMTESAKMVARGKTAVVIGGGAGRSEETQEVIAEYLSQSLCPAVIDADAIHALSNKTKILANKPYLLTPHSYEFFVLTGKEIGDKTDEEKMAMVREAADRLQTTILLKGKIDIISDGKETALNKTGISFMTVGGTGDTLAGIAGALMARGISPFLAAQAAAFINGLAGEAAGKKLGESLMATDLIEHISGVLPNL